MKNKRLAKLRDSKDIHIIRRVAVRKQRAYELSLKDKDFLPHSYLCEKKKTKVRKASKDKIPVPQKKKVISALRELPEYKEWIINRTSNTDRKKVKKQKIVERAHKLSNDDLTCKERRNIRKYGTPNYPCNKKTKK